MVKSDNGKTKKDCFTKVMIAQFLVCGVIIALLLISAKSAGEFASLVTDAYRKYMVNDFSVADAADAFRSIREYAAVFSQETETTSVIHTESTTEKVTEEQSVYIGGGADLEFTSLDALEGVCFDSYEVDFPYCMPVKEFEITSEFGYRISPVSGKTGIHTGLDMAAEYRTPIYAFASGTVVDASYDKSYGCYVKIQHPDNFVSIYAHCSVLCAEAGDKVKKGEMIARVGSTGDSTGNHLHFEMRKDNIRIDPAYILFADEI